MKIKRYVAANMRQALREVRREQGADAVILSNRPVADGIEVVAAVDYDETLIHHSLGAVQPDAVENSAPDDEPAAPADVPDAAAAAPPELDLTRLREDVWARDSEIGEMRNAMNDMRGLLEDQLASLAWNDQTRRDPATVCLLRHFAAIGLDADVARAVASRAVKSHDSGNYVETASAALEKSLATTRDRILEDGGVVALVGPTGVGKTTTIAKLAAHFALRHGRDSVALVSTDSFRIGAQEQLATFAQILDVPVHLAADQKELARVLRSLAHKKLVLIDTAGVSQRDRALTERLNTLRSGTENICIYLALPANGQSRALDEVVREFGRVALSGCILTKIDEAGSIGGALAALIRHQLPLAYVANGQRVPEDLHRAASKIRWLVHYATRLSREAKISLGEDYMARNFGEVRTHALA